MNKTKLKYTRHAQEHVFIQDLRNHDVTTGQWQDSFSEVKLAEERLAINKK